LAASAEPEIAAAGARLAQMETSVKRLIRENGTPRGIAAGKRPPGLIGQIDRVLRGRFEANTHTYAHKL
jgi:hypothetical protein